MTAEPSPASRIGRRAALAGAATFGAGILAARGAAAAEVNLPFANGIRPVAPAGRFPQKGAMIVQRVRAPLLETPWEVFRKHLFIPNNQTYVRWHIPDFPTHVDLKTFRLSVDGEVEKPFSLTLDELVREFPATRAAAINQCSGNSRGFIDPRVPGAQWGHGAMFNAMWTGAPLHALLARAGVKPGATHVAFHNIEELIEPIPPHALFYKVLPLARATDPSTMVAYEMNGTQLPLLNGFPIRLIVPGWYATYWVKMLTRITVTTHPGTGFWMNPAYTIPDTPGGAMTPGQAGVKMVPINAMVPRSFITGPAAGARIHAGKPTKLEGFAFGGGSALTAVEVSTDGGASWQKATLGKDWGAYGSRAWSLSFTPAARGPVRLMVRASNQAGAVQPMKAGWNPGGFMYNAIEHVDVHAV
ncbi:MAG: molybdopterin-dependent oxidoreductase [Rhodospirillales bacterium]|nr:molybdopterin-dependent oxidoreductase [Rhodospirillales bacterium]